MLLRLELACDINHRHGGVELWTLVITHEFAVPIIVVWLLTTLRYFEVVYELIGRSAVQLCSRIVKVTTAGFDCSIKNVFVCVNIIVLPMLDQAVAVLRLEANISVDEHRMIDFDESIAIFSPMLLIASPWTWRLSLFNNVMLVGLFANALSKKASAPF